MKGFDRLVILANCLFWGLIGIGDPNPIYSQESLDVNLGFPLDVREPQDEGDFANQCRANLQSQGILSVKAQQYCECAANVVYNESNLTDSSKLSDVQLSLARCLRYLEREEVE